MKGSHIRKGKNTVLKTQSPDTTLEEKNKVGGLILHEFKTYYKVTVIKTVRYCQKNKQIDH